MASEPWRKRWAFPCYGFFPKLLLKLALVYKGENVLSLSKNEKTNLSSAQSGKLQDLVAFFFFYEIFLSKVKYNVSSRR